MNKRVTREDVARAAGVSAAVVSRALNNSGYVKKEKKERILQIAEQLNYNPNSLALSLQTRRSHQLMFIRDDLTGAYHIQMFHGVAREAQRQGYSVLLDMQCQLETIRNLMIDGVIFSGEGIAKAYAERVGRTYFLPTVTICQNPSVSFAKPMPCVVLDDRRVVNMAVDYLQAKGHRRIGLVIPFEYNYSDTRLRWWRERMEFDGLEGYQNWLIKMNGRLSSSEQEMQQYFSDFNGFEYYDLFESGREAAHKFAALPYRPSAVLCFNDDMAHGMIQELESLGIDVPRELSVMGIDGTYIRNHFPKRLTSVATYPERMGARCVDILVDMLEERPYKFMNYSEVEILEGDTVRTLG